MNRKFKGGKSAIRGAVKRAVIRPGVGSVVRAATRAAVPLRPVPPALKKAHTMMGKSKYSDAGNIFEQFANSMLASHEKRAPQFYVQAGRARMMSGEVPAGIALLKVGLAALISSGNLTQVALIAQRIIAELTDNGMASEADQIQQMLNQVLPAEAMPATSTREAGAETEVVRLLPTNCPSCGGPLLPQEVEWMDAYTAECPYCGNGVRTEVEEEENDEAENQS